ncbi:MAG TPA: hypothetical protein VI194_08600 [Mycobacterium sp.]
MTDITLTEANPFCSASKGERSGGTTNYRRSSPSFLVCRPAPCWPSQLQGIIVRKQ